MTPREEYVFLKAASTFAAWIFVRLPNPLSSQYTGKALYQPKPISCKAKTANRPIHEKDKRVAGLVADPHRWPEAFSADKLPQALELWDEFRLQYHLGYYTRGGNGFIFQGNRSSPLGYAINVEPGSVHEGCLTLEGKYLYGDFDLFGIVFLERGAGGPPAAKPKPVALLEAQPVATGPKYAKAFQVTDQRDAKWDEIARFINGQLGVPLIQHGSQFLYRPHEFEAVLAFGPDRSSAELWSAQQVQEKYQAWNITLAKS